MLLLLLSIVTYNTIFCVHSCVSFSLSVETRLLAEQGRAEVWYLRCLGPLGPLGSLSGIKMLQNACENAVFPLGFECPETNNQNYKMANVPLSTCATSVAVRG